MARIESNNAGSDVNLLDYYAGRHHYPFPSPRLRFRGQVWQPQNPTQLSLVEQDHRRLTCYCQPSRHARPTEKRSTIEVMVNTAAQFSHSVGLVVGGATWGPQVIRTGRGRSDGATYKNSLSHTDAQGSNIPNIPYVPVILYRKMNPVSRAATKKPPRLAWPSTAFSSASVPWPSSSRFCASLWDTMGDVLEAVQRIPNLLLLF